jgi:hypothetical protein
MWWWRKVRRANIPQVDRDVFERLGENLIALILASGLTPQAPVLQNIFKNPNTLNNATNWLTERGDAHQRHEDRIETVEWAILIFVVLGVILDVVMIFF